MGCMVLWSPSILVEAFCVVADAIVERMLLDTVDGIDVAVVSVVLASGSGCCVVGGAISYGLKIAAVVGVNAVM